MNSSYNVTTQKDFTDDITFGCRTLDSMETDPTHPVHGTKGVETVATATKPQKERKPNRRIRQITSGLRKSSSSLIRSFTQIQPRFSSITGCTGGNGGITAEQTARQVAEELFADSPRSNLVSSPRSSPEHSPASSVHSNNNSDDGAYPSAAVTTTTYSSTVADESPHSSMTLGPWSQHSVNDLQEDDFDKLAAEVGTSAVKYLEECISTEVNVLDREKFNSIPEYQRTDLLITTHLGKGTFSDVFEVGITVPLYDDELSDSLHNIDLKVDQLATTKTTNDSSRDNANTLGAPALVRRSSRGSRRGSLCSSMISRPQLNRPSRYNERNLVFAMKCLRPQIRADAEQFVIGAEDLVHETAMLASLNHPNIVKVYGRAAGNLEKAFRLNDGYFILLDKLEETLEDRIDLWRVSAGRTMNQLTWQHQSPMLHQFEVAYSITNAMAYLHSNNIVFRDLKPANVGFDRHGVLKLFDFGFAIGLSPKEDTGKFNLLYDRCGTPRYMAPEVGLELGCGVESDVYSFGILLWEICALKKPFANIKSAGEFEMSVFMNGKRPILKKCWPEGLKEIMTNCWNKFPNSRPSMVDVKSVLCDLKNNIGKGGNTPPRMSELTRRLSMDF